MLDVGSGTGRALFKSHPTMHMIGTDASPEMREQRYAKGLTPHELLDGDAQELQFQDESFDLVCDFGVLHHIPKPKKAESMLSSRLPKASPMGIWWEALDLREPI